MLDAPALEAGSHAHTPGAVGGVPIGTEVGILNEEPVGGSARRGWRLGLVWPLRGWDHFKWLRVTGRGRPAERMRDSRHGPEGLKRPALRRRSSLDRPHLLHQLVLGVVDEVCRRAPPPPQPYPGPPPRLHEDVVARKAGRPPPEALPELDALFVHVLPVEALVGGLAVFADQVLGQHVAGELGEPRERGVRARDPAPHTGLEGEEQHPQQALPDLVAVLDDAVGLVLVRGRHLLEHRVGQHRLDPPPQGIDRVLIVGLDDERARDPEVLDALHSGLDRHALSPFVGHHPAPDRARLPVLHHEHGDDAILIVPPAERVVHVHLRHRGLLLALALVGRVVQPPRDAVRTPHPEREVGGLVLLPLSTGRGPRVPGQGRPPRLLGLSGRVTVARRGGPGARLVPSRTAFARRGGPGAGLAHTNTRGLTVRCGTLGHSTRGLTVRCGTLCRPLLVRHTCLTFCHWCEAGRHRIRPHAEPLLGP